MLVQQTSESDADAAAAALESFFPGVVLGSAQGPVYFRMDGYANDHGLAFVEIGLGGQRMSTELKDTSGLMVTTAVSLDGGMTDSGREIDSRQPYVTRAGLRSEYAAAHCRTIAISEHVVEAYVRRRGDGDLKGGLRFTGTGPRSEQHAATWRSLAATVASAMRSGLADDPLLGPTMTDMVAACVVACFPSTWSATEAVSGTAPTATIRRAKAFIEEHAPEPITVVDIADAARLSVRGLQSAFKSQVGVSPMAYLRQVRLGLARASLLAADPADDDRVAAIARASGFVHLSRFAAAYRALHGENPNDTLRR